MNAMDLSVVITTYNRAEGLQELLDAFAAQEAQDFQVVVAIDGSTDDTEAMLARQSQPYDLKWVNTHCSGYGLAVARNLGILAADGRAVVVLDDDSFPDPGFIAAHRSSVRQGVITGGPRAPSNPEAAPRMAWKMAELAKLPPCTPKTIARMRREHPTAWLIENNVCLLREDWIGMGLFSERLKMYGFIGQEFFARADFLGMEYQYNPAASVTHHSEMEGNNAFTRDRKHRQTRIATLLRPSLERAHHYRAQIAWAQAMAHGKQPPALPPYKAHAALAMPYRIVRQALSGARSMAKRHLKALLGKRAA